MSTNLVDTGPTTVTWTWYVNGDKTDVGSVTVTITDGNGTAVATAASTTNNADGTYTYSLAVQTNTTILKFEWTDGTSTQIDTMTVVGGWLYTENAARAFDDSALTSASKYPDKDIAAIRQQVTADLATWTHRAWVPRYCRVELPGNGRYGLPLADAYLRLSDGTPLRASGFLADIRNIISVTVGGVTVTTSNVKIIAGELLRTDATWTQPTTADPLNVVIEYEYGVDPMTDGSDRIGLLLTRDRLIASNISDRASSFSDEVGSYQFVTPGVGRAVSNIPEVNRWVMDHQTRVLVF